MKIINIILVILLISLNAYGKDYVIITEVMYDSPLPESEHIAQNNGEYIELYNAGYNEVDLTGWSMYGNEPTAFGFPDGTLLPPKSYLIVAYRNKYTPDFKLESLFSSAIADNGNRQILYQNIIVLNNKGEEIGIFDKAQRLKDHIVYGSFVRDGIAYGSGKLIAKNGEGKPAEQCLSLQRMSANFDNDGNAIFSDSDWISGLVTPFTQSSSFNEDQIERSFSRNYVVKATPLYEATRVIYSSNEMLIEDGVNVLQEINYFDGLGRLDHTIQVGITPTERDLVSYHEYDNMGREAKKWLSAPNNHDNGHFLVNPQNIISSYYGDDNPFSSYTYSSSPLNKVSEQYAPGKRWYNAKKPVKTEYFSNTQSGDFSCNSYTISVSGGITTVTKGVYSAGELFVTKITDENSYIAYEFRDKQNRVVLVRQMNGSGQYNTYFVYDDFGNLRYVLPPMMPEFSQLKDDDTNAKKYVYIYYYDGRNRCIKKRLPGCDWIEYKYDEADRVIFSQDGEQRKSSSAATERKWFCNIYDILGRVVVAGECNNVSSEKVVGSEYQNTGYDNFGGYRPIHIGFSWDSFKALTINYYDNYDFLSRTGFSNLKYDAKTGYNTRYGNDSDKTAAKGLLTGTVTAILDGSGKYIYTALYYDNKGRLIQTKSTNHMGGVDKEYVSYNFVGQPKQQLSEHTSSTNGSVVSELYTYTYDHAGRLMETKHKLNNNAEIVLAKNNYDELGRLKQTTSNNQAKLKTDYAYNIRSWVNSITNPLYKQSLSYTYNGNVETMNWGESTMNQSYMFMYDGLSRLTRAVFQNTSSPYIDYSTTYNYDKNGNITDLTRKGTRSYYNSWDYTSVEDLDIMFYSYNGNQVKQIDDHGSASLKAEVGGFTNYRGGYGDNVTEYAYDANGSMTQDLNKGISSIKYNSLNLPNEVQIKNPVAEAQNIYTYSAGGTKLKVVHKWNPSRPVNPILGTTVNLSLLTKSKTTDYVGNKIYEDGSLKTIQLGDGYYDNIDKKYYFYIKDHLGNNRVVADASGNVVQRNSYYPFGMTFGYDVGEGVQSFKYGDKELDKMHGLNLYDFEARTYDPAVARFTTMDPHAEKYYSISPYAYCANNPMRYIDPDGKDYITIVDEDEKTITISATYYASTQDLESALEAATAWNQLSGKFTYSGGNGDYVVVFSLLVVEVPTTESMTPGEIRGVLNMAAQTDGTGGANVYQVVADSQMKSNQNGTTGGGNYIQVKDSRSSGTETGAHEVGHSLGLTHQGSGLMHPSSSERTDNSVTSRDIRDMITSSLKGESNSERGVKAGKGTTIFSPSSYSTDRNQTYIDNNGKVQKRY